MLIIFLLTCQAFLQLDATFNVATPRMVQQLEEKLVKLSEKNPSNRQLGVYLESIKNVPTDELNSYRRMNNAQTLLFPLNTDVSERFLKTSEINVPRSSWLPSMNWFKRPWRQCYNIGTEGMAIISDTQASLNISDCCWMGGGYLLADSVARRLNNENWMVSLAVSPLYIVAPLAALWLKKCRFDMYPIAQSSIQHLDHKSNELRAGNVELIHARNRLGNHNIDLQLQNERMQDFVRNLGQENNNLRAGNVALTHARNSLQDRNNNLQIEHERAQAKIKKQLRNKTKQQQLAQNIVRSLDTKIRTLKDANMQLIDERTILQDYNNNLQIEHAAELKNDQKVRLLSLMKQKIQVQKQYEIISLQSQKNTEIAASVQKHQEPSIFMNKIKEFIQPGQFVSSLESKLESNLQKDNNFSLHSKVPNVKISSFKTNSTNLLPVSTMSNHKATDQISSEVQPGLAAMLERNVTAKNTQAFMKKIITKL